LVCIKRKWIQRSINKVGKVAKGILRITEKNRNVEKATSYNSTYPKGGD
jgi:hypothetical protein